MIWSRSQRRPWKTCKSRPMLASTMIPIDAILGEKRERGGQSFFVYNGIETMPAMLDHLKSILPDTISIGVTYGRMDGAVLEKVMLDFYRGYDVLLLQP